MSNYKRFHNPSYKYVFFTIVTYNRNPILIENIELLRISFKYALSKYNFEVFAINVLKDHIHLLLKLNDNNDYSEIIRLIKYYFSTIKRREKGISHKQRITDYVFINETRRQGCFYRFNISKCLGL